jgi:Fe-S oxidoreductase
MAPLSNRLAASTPGRWVAQAVVGIDRRRTLPEWSRHTFSMQLERRRSVRSRGPDADNPRPGESNLAENSSTRTPVIFCDTFTEYSDPAIGLAAVDVLEAAGIRPRLERHECCGRPLISQGLLEEARDLAALNAHRLYDAARRGNAIVFLEPSCLSAIREDAPDLLRGDAQRKARVVAGASVLFEEYLERECDAGRAALTLGAGPGTIVLHSHCHQRAMGLVGPAKALLSRVPGAVVQDLDAGCCGMAGSFGYAREHYDISRAIAELKLLPAARALPADAVLVASGTSCRHQVAHFTGVKATHPAVLLQSLLRGHT